MRGGRSRVQDRVRRGLGSDGGAWLDAVPIAIAACAPIALFLAASVRLRASARGRANSLRRPSARDEALATDLRARLTRTRRRHDARARCDCGGCVRRRRHVARDSTRAEDRAAPGMRCSASALAIALSIVNATVARAALRAAARRASRACRFGLRRVAGAGSLDLEKRLKTRPFWRRDRCTLHALDAARRHATRGFATTCGSFFGARACAFRSRCDSAHALLPPPLDDSDVANAAPGSARSRARSIGRVATSSSFPIDALRADHVGAYGYARATTPNIDALAKSGAVFEHAYRPTPHTSHSVTSMMTKHAHAAAPPNGSRCGQRDVRRASCVIDTATKQPRFTRRRCSSSTKKNFSASAIAGSTSNIAKWSSPIPRSRETQIQAISIARTRTAPMFLLGAHLRAPRALCVSCRPSVRRRGVRPTDVDRYDSEIATADDLVGRVTRLVREKRHNPVFIVTADHGEEFGDHGGHQHGTTVFEEQVRVPLVIAGEWDSARANLAARPDDRHFADGALGARRSAAGARARARSRRGSRTAGRARFESRPRARLRIRRHGRLRDGRAAKPAARLPAKGCTLHALRFDVGDPAEKRDISRDHPADLEAMKKLLRTTELSHGRF